MATRKSIENLRIRKSDDLCKMAEDLGYKRPWGQLQCNNGAFVSSLLDFLDDNPGAMEAIQEWALKNCDLDETDDEEDECENEEDE
jgi:hypothetical protein